jgi:hypothetical protein
MDSTSILVAYIIVILFVVGVVSAFIKKKSSVPKPKGGTTWTSNPDDNPEDIIPRDRL